MTDLLASGIDRSELDPAIRPQDDLYRHVNARWVARTPIPADKARYGSFLVLAEEAEKAVREIIEESQTAEPGTLQKKVGDLYASFMDADRIERLGAAPLAPLLAEVDAIGDVPGLLDTLGRLERRGVAGVVQLFVDNDPGDPERYLIFVEQGGIGLPDESYYRDDAHADTRVAYRGHVERMLALAGLDLGETVGLDLFGSHDGGGLGAGLVLEIDVEARRNRITSENFSRRAVRLNGPQEPEIVLGMLQIVFGQNPVTR